MDQVVRWVDFRTPITSRRRPAFSTTNRNGRQMLPKARPPSIRAPLRLPSTLTRSLCTILHPLLARSLVLVLTTSSPSCPTIISLATTATTTTITKTVSLPLCLTQNLAPLLPCLRDSRYPQRRISPSLSLCPLFPTLTGVLMSILLTLLSFILLFPTTLLDRALLPLGISRSHILSFSCWATYDVLLLFSWIRWSASGAASGAAMRRLDARDQGENRLLHFGQAIHSTYLA